MAINYLEISTLADAAQATAATHLFCHQAGQLRHVGPLQLTMQVIHLLKARKMRAPLLR